MVMRQARAKVFLSSTTVGLKEVRNIAAETIKAAGCDPIEMEEFGAVPDIPDSVCQDKIAESDFYVGLIGWRHGSRPRGSDQSYTEREYLYARLRGLPCLIFLLGEDLCRAELSAPAEEPRFRTLQEDFRNTVREVTTVSVSDLEQLRAEVTRSLGNALRDEPWGARDVIGRRKFLRSIKHEITAENLNLALIGLPGIGKSALAHVFRDAPPEGYRVWYQELPEMSAPDATADITGLTTNDLAVLAHSALGHAASDKTLPQLADLLRDQLSDGTPTIVVLDNVWPAHVGSLRTLYQRLASYDQVRFLITSRFHEVPGLLASSAPRILTRQVPVLDLDAGLDLLAWTVATQMGEESKDIRPDLRLLREALRPLARHADGYPAMLQILAGLLVRQGHTLEALRRSADDIEHELAEVREGLRRSLGPDEELHASTAYDAALEHLLGSWLKADGLPGPARDVLGICAILPPRPASYSGDTLQLHWRAAGEASIGGWAADRGQAPELYDLEGAEGPRARAFRRQLAYLRKVQLLQAAKKPAGRESRCEDADAALPEEHYTLHAIVAGFFGERLLDAGQRTALHEAAEQALRGQLEEGPLSNMFGMYALEGTRWQARVSLWLYHLAHLARVQPTDARARMASLYLDAFWWWGYYEPFAFCELLVSNWERVVVPPETADDHVSFVRHLRALEKHYPKGWEKEGSDMRPVRAALTGIAALIGVDVDAPPASYDDDENRLHMQGLLRVFLGDCAFFRSRNKPIPEADYAEALESFRAALASFARRREQLKSYADEWNEAWTQYEVADLHASAGKLDEADELCRQAEALERDRIERAGERGEEDYLLEETLGDIARVRADIAESRGDLAEEARQRARAVVHAYAFQVRPPQAIPCENDPDRYEGGPDKYTGSFYREMTDRAVLRILGLIADSQQEAAREMARQLASCWRRQDLPEVAEFLNPATASAESPRQEVLRHALFPPPFNEQRDDLDGYIQRGLQLAADAEQALL
jgi:tetratricopeptide (TPR) repeat protein